MATIDQFKAQLTGGGARANQFRVTMNTPGAVATGLDARRTSFLVKAAACLLYTSPSPRDRQKSRMPSSA